MNDEPTDQDIACGLRHGKREAWSALCEKYGDRLWAHIAKLVGADSAAAADVFQETLLGSSPLGSATPSSRQPSLGVAGNDRAPTILPVLADGRIGMPKSMQN